MAFDRIDIDRTGFIDFEYLLKFFYNNNIYPYEEEIILILKRLDRDDDGRISLEDFTFLFNANPFGLSSSTGLSNKTPLKKTQELLNSMRLSPQRIRGENDFPTFINSNNSIYSGKKLNSRMNNYSDDKNLVNSCFNSKNYSQLNYPFQAVRKHISPIRNNYKSIYKSNGNYLYIFIYSFLIVDFNNAKYTSPLIRQNREIYQNYSPEKVEKIYNGKVYESKYIISPQEFSKTTDIKEKYLNRNKQGNINDQYSDFHKFMSNLKKILLYEKEVEKAKEELTLKSDFNIDDFFNVFSNHGKIYISNEEIERALTDFGIHPKTNELYLFLRRFNKGIDNEKIE